MPRVSRQRLNKQIATVVEQNWIEVVSSLKGKQLASFFQDFLTVEEKTMLAKRLALFTLIDKELTESEIKQILKVSRETIRTARNSFANKNQDFKKSLTNLSLRTGTGEGNRLLKALELALRSKGDVRARAKLLNGDY